jgi:hypothetical protein
MGFEARNPRILGLRQALWSANLTVMPPKRVRYGTNFEEAAMAKGQEKPKTNNKPKLSVKEKKAKKKEKAK